MKTQDLAKGVSKFIRNIRSTLLSDHAREQLSQAYAFEAAAAIKSHTRKGYGLQQDGDNLSPLKRLSPMYAERRKAMRLHPETTPGKSNLTRRGNMLDSITAKRYLYPNWGVAMPGEHYSGLTNRQLARIHSLGLGRVPKRPFLFLSRNEQTALFKNHLNRFNALVRAKI